MLYSVKMRSAQGGPHEQGGRHISGAERILSEEKIEQAIVAMLHRAQKHQRGMADFISLKVEAVKTADIFYRPLLPLSSCQADSVMAGRKAAAEELVKAGVSTEAAAAGISRIINLRDSMRGAMLLDADTGLRVDSLGERGDHVREALVLASKVASAVGVVAELCWSDDPEYVTGYVASAKYGYKRIPVLKEYGNPIGGRVFFVEQGTDVQKLITYLQDQVVLIRPEDK